jgi:hypothetical protein
MDPFTGYILLNLLALNSSVNVRAFELVDLNAKEITKSDLLLPLNGPLVFFHAEKTIDDQILLIGGNNRSKSLNDIYLFDYNKNIFTKKQSMKNNRVFHTVNSNSNGKSYIIGGRESNNSKAKNKEIESFDPIEGGTKIVGNLIYPRYGHQSLFINEEEILIIGGRDPGENLYILDSEIFNVSTGASRLAGKIKNGRQFFQIHRLENTLYIFGGVEELESATKAIKIIEKLNLAAIDDHSDEVDASLETGVHSFPSLNRGGKIYIYGGIEGNGKFNYDTQIFDLDNETTASIKNNLNTSSGHCLMETKNQQLFIGYGSGKNGSIQKLISDYNFGSNRSSVQLTGIVDRQYQACINIGNNKFLVFGRIPP